MLFNPEKIRPPHFMLAFLMFATVLHLAFHPVGIIAKSYQWMGYIVIIMGLVIMTISHQWFTKHDTPVPHSEKPRAVVTSGPYQYSRNPMYVAGALIFLGIALCVGTWPFFVAWLLMGFVLNQCFIPWEEKRMEGLFGENYLNYKKRTRRWL